MSCDPSFKGMAWAFYCPGIAWQDAAVYDIREDRKIYDTIEMIRDLSYRHLVGLQEDFPLMQHCEILVIEGQFKRKMMRLVETICSQMRVFMPRLKIFVVPAHTTRTYFGTNTASYYQNKKESIRFLRANPQFLCGELWINDDNICEAIILLNHLQQKKSLQFESSKSIETLMSSPKCPTCKEPTHAATSNSEKNPGKAYWKCANQNCQKYIDKKSFICWIGEESSIGKPFTKYANTAAVNTQPPTVQPATSRQTGKPGPDPSTLLRAISSVLTELRADVQEILRRTEALERHVASQPVTTLACDEQMAESQEDGVSDYWQ